MLGDNAMKNTQGFTLLEMLVVTALFITLSIIIVDVFLLSLGAQRQTSERQTSISNARFVMQTLASQIRTSQIDYLAYADSSIPSPADELWLIGSNGLRYRYYISNNALWVATSGLCQNDNTCSSDGASCIGVGSLCSTVAAPMVSSAALHVTQLAFTVDPYRSPFVQEQCTFNNDCAVSSTGCSICPERGVGDCPLTEERFGFCRCDSDSDCQVTDRCDVASGLCVPFDLQPRVTISLGVESQGDREEEVKVEFLQTTITSRVYQR